MFLLIPCDQQQSTDRSLISTGLCFVPFLWCYILVVQISGSCNPFQNFALKAADCCIRLKEVKPIDSSLLRKHLLSFLVLVPQNKVIHVTCVRQHISINGSHLGWKVGFSSWQGQTKVQSLADQALHISFMCYAACH